MGLVSYCQKCRGEIRPGDELDRQPCRACLEAEVKRLSSELSSTRASHGKILRTIKRLLGFNTWPNIERDFIDGVLGLLEAEVARLRADHDAMEILRWRKWALAYDESPGWEGWEVSYMRSTSYIVNRIGDPAEAIRAAEAARAAGEDA